MAKKQKGPRAPVSGDVATNRRARHKFQMLETMEAGIELRGSEVKSLRDGKAQLNEAYAVVNDGEVWLRGAHIPPCVTSRTKVRAGDGVIGAMMPAGLGDPAMRG